MYISIKDQTSQQIAEEKALLLKQIQHFIKTGEVHLPKPTK